MLPSGFPVRGNIRFADAAGRLLLACIIAPVMSLGVAKVNVASELVRAVRESLQEQWAAGRNLWTPAALAEAARATAAAAERWIRRTGAEGRK